MAQTFDAGHTETVRNLPRPLQSGRYPGTWALPATTLSATSLVVLLVVLLFLQAGETSRALFRLPVSAGWPALAAAVMAWGIALCCLNRPGRPFPRWWVLGLAILSTGVALTGFLAGELGKSPLLHALSMATLMSSVTLLPRLLKLQPDRRLVQHVAPLGLVIVLFIALPAAFAFGRKAVDERKQRVADTIAELSREAEEVRAVSSFNWTKDSDRRPEAIGQMERFQALPLEPWVPDRYLWQGAAILGEEERLGASYRALLDAVVAGIDPARTPKLWQPQFVWNREAQRWERDPVFADLSAAVAGYHWRSGQLLRALEPPAGDDPVLRDLAAYYGNKKAEAGERLKAFSGTWDEDWAPPLVEAREPGSRASVSPLADLLRRPLLEDDSLRPVSLEKLLELKLGKSRTLFESARGCGERAYDEDDFEYVRMDCYAYAARLDPEKPGVDLRVELRVVYKSEEFEELGRGDLPTELFFLFPVPSGSQASQYREDVMAALAAAVREEHGGATLTMIDRSGSAGKGFSFETAEGRRLRVVSSPIDDLSGGVPGIQVRAYDRGRTL
ncbi:MAG TPA: hypothetical protein VKK31_29215 [Thermoanaerobaculia bacterium]|nr:hypothetical protein [Thermoanaerobaculia bacterium]